jgi:hypothetical protein
MLVDHARSESFFTAVSKTFDGQHPCSKCHEVQEQKSKQEQSPEQILLKLSELKAANPFLGSFLNHLSASSKPFYFSKSSLALSVNRSAPPLPPPQA